MKARTFWGILVGVPLLMATLLILIDRIWYATATPELGPEDRWPTLMIYGLIFGFNLAAIVIAIVQVVLSRSNRRRNRHGPLG